MNKYKYFTILIDVTVHFFVRCSNIHSQYAKWNKLRNLNIGLNVLRLIKPKCLITKLFSWHNFDLNRANSILILLYQHS